MLSKNGASAPIDIQVRKDVIAHIDAPPEVKGGVSESKRKEIYREIVLAEDRADSEAKRLYPEPDPLKPGYSSERAGEQLMKQLDVQKDLANKYRAEVADQFGISGEQLREISREGLTKDWPMPPSASN